MREETKIKISKARKKEWESGKRKGHPITKEHKLKISKAQKKCKLGIKNPNWVGDNIGYNGLHTWVKRYLKKPEKCQKCDKIKPLDLSNKGVYDRNLKNWEWICRRCHMIIDGRIYKLRKIPKKIIQKDISGKTIKKWDSIKEASTQLKFNRSGINHCICKDTKTYKNFIWEYEM